MPGDWTKPEVEVIVAAYFDMLAKEHAGVPYVKAETRKRILPLLNKRSEGSVEFKNRNISAVLARIGQPYITGYLPAYNYQKTLLEEAVFGHLKQKPEVEETFRLFAETAVEPVGLQFDGMEEEMPKKKPIVQEPGLSFRSPVKINYIEKEQSNRRIGRSGEIIAMEFERWRLIRAGKENLINKIEWVSETLGDGLGYDILSKNIDGTDRYIEVKSTKLTKEAPFFFSESEFQFSRKYSSKYFLYRLFNLRMKPKLFIANGSYDEFCNLRPTQYKGSF